MSKADELLESMVSGPSARTVNPATEPHIVINPDRTITVPSELKKIAVQFDHNIETVTFDCPSSWDGHDLSTMSIYINYLTPDNKPGSYEVMDAVIDSNDPSIMHFTWTISGYLTQAKGNITFLVCAKKADASGNMINHWNSELNRDLQVTEGLETSIEDFDLKPDVIEQILIRIDILERNGGGGGSGSSGVPMFEGTWDEYRLRYNAGTIPVGTIVIITDEEGDSSGGSSVLGEAVLGEMILG